MNYYKERIQLLRMKTVHTFRIIEEEGLAGEQIFPQTDMTIESEASLEDMLYAFERFLEAVGYVLPKNGTLDFVIDEPLPSKYDNTYKGKF